MSVHRRSDLIGASLVWLLEVTYAGRVHRWSTYPVTLSSDDGDISFEGALGEIDFEETVDRLTVNAAISEVTLEVVFPVDVAQLHRNGHRLHGSRAELSTVAVRNGAVLVAYEGRVVHLSGDVAQPQYAAPQRDVGWASFTIVGSATEDVARFIAGSQRVSASTWSDTDDEVVDNYGQPYPIVIGSPGEWYEGSTQRLHGFTPAYVVVWDDTPLGTPNGAETVVIAGHHVKATQVTVYGDGAGYTATVTNAKDNLDQPVATADITGAAAEIRTASSFLVAWGVNAGASQPGLTNPYRPGLALRGAGDVLRWALSRSSMPIDHAAFAAAAPALNALKVDTYIDDPEVSPWEWVRQLVEILPVSIRRGSRGLYPILHDTGRASPPQAVAVTEGPDFRRVGPVQVETDFSDLATEVTVEYVPRSSSGEFAQTLTAAGTIKTSDASRTTTAHSRVGHAWVGVRREVLSLSLVFDAATAAAILRRRVRERSSVMLTIPYEADPSWGWLTAGQLVAITDSDLYYTDQIAEVSSKEWLGTHWRFVLLILEDPVRDNRA